MAELSKDIELDTRDSKARKADIRAIRRTVILRCWIRQCSFLNWEELSAEFPKRSTDTFYRQRSLVVLVENISFPCAVPKLTFPRCPLLEQLQALIWVSSPSLSPLTAWCILTTSICQSPKRNWHVSNGSSHEKQRGATAGKKPDCK